jgi:hypothetical protein
MQITRAFSFILLAIAAGACSSSSSKSVPVIDNLNMPATASVSTVQTTSGPQQAYEITGTLDYHDDSESVVSFQVHVVSPSNFADGKPVDFPQPFASKGTVAPILAIPAGNGLSAGTVINYQITIQSASGLNSAPSSETLTLQ